MVNRESVIELVKESVNWLIGESIEVNESLLEEYIKETTGENVNVLKYERVNDVLGDCSNVMFKYREELYMILTRMD